ncbi:MAG: histidine phosphatase family protein [Chlamydiia bacterium]|nr:histidine phosphatase family protein [Chlamydiia bacterium]
MKVFLCRHGETAWSLSGRHTSFTDIPLTEKGIEEALQLKKRLAKVEFTHVFVSPLQRAMETCRLAGLLEKAKVEPDLVEWNYGVYEGLTTPQIQESVPEWNIFTHGAPEGESIEDVQRRADRTIERFLECEGSVACFSSGHFSRVLGARWAGLSVAAGKVLKLSTASLSILGFEHDYRVIELWNDTDFL